jgi:Holliday junction resolvasome RuvABC ATP-dependent DNA helicase subunit
MIETDRLIAPAAVSPVEEQIERALRPRTLAEYVGQAKAQRSARPCAAVRPAGLDNFSNSRSTVASSLTETCMILNALSNQAWAKIE